MVEKNKNRPDCQNRNGNLSLLAGKCAIALVCISTVARPDVLVCGRHTVLGAQLNRMKIHFVCWNGEGNTCRHWAEHMLQWQIEIRTNRTVIRTGRYVTAILLELFRLCSLALRSMGYVPVVSKSNVREWNIAKANR